MAIAAVAKGVTPGGDDRLPIRMLHDRVLVSTEGEAGERQTGGGLVIPATASIGKRLAWAAVVAIGQHVRQVKVGDRVLYDPCLLYTSPSPRDGLLSRLPSSA